MTEPDFFTQITAEILGVGYMDVDQNTRRRVKAIILQLAYRRFELPNPVVPFPDYKVVGTTITRQTPTNQKA